MTTYLSSLDFKKIIVRSVLAILVGVFFCTFPNLSADFIFYVLGGAILFTGIVSFLTVFTRKDIRPGGIQYLNLCLSLLVGMALLITPHSFVRLLMILLGLIIVFSGIAQIVSLWTLRKWNVKPAFVEYTFALLLIILGCFICIYPDYTNNFLFTLFGIGCIFYGLTNLFVSLHMCNKLKKAGKNISQGVIEDIDFELEDN